jgi:hypothetical protein
MKTQSKCYDRECGLKIKCAIAQGLINGKQVIKGFINGECKQYVPVKKETINKN